MAAVTDSPGVDGRIPVSVCNIEGRDRGGWRLLLDASTGHRRGSLVTEFPLAETAHDLVAHGMRWRVWLRATDAEYTRFDIESATPCPWVDAAR